MVWAVRIAKVFVHFAISCAMPLHDVNGLRHIYSTRALFERKLSSLSFWLIIAYCNFIVCTYKVPRLSLLRHAGLNKYGSWQHSRGSRATDEAWEKNNNRLYISFTRYTYIINIRFCCSRCTNGDRLSRMQFACYINKLLGVKSFMLWAKSIIAFANNSDSKFVLMYVLIL